MDNVFLLNPIWLSSLCTASSVFQQTAELQDEDLFHSFKDKCTQEDIKELTA